MPKKILLGISLASLALGWLSEPAAPAAAAAVGGGRSSTKNTASNAQRPCPTCVQAIGLEGFRAGVSGDITPVIVELNEPSVLSRQMAGEAAGRALSFEGLTSHAAALRGRQRAFIASLSGRGVRALLRENNVQQVDGSVRHVEYQLTYLLNAFVLFVASEDLPRLRAMPEVHRVFAMPQTRLLLDKAIDYSLGMQTNILDRRLAVYGATNEWSPFPVAGHPEAPEATRIDGYEGQGMIIAIIDSGLDWRHPMFGGTGQNTPLPYVSGSTNSPNDNQKVIYYYALSSPGKLTDDFGHGTLVSSCAAGYKVDGSTPPNAGYGIGVNNTGVGPTPNGVTLHGMAPQARLMAYKVCGPADACAGDIELAIEDAASPYTLVGSTSGTVTNTFVPKPVADVINLSLGDTTGDPASFTSVVANNAVLAGTIVVTAAGNSGPGPSTLGSPGAATLAITPGASLDPGSISFADLLAATQSGTNQIPGETGSTLGGPSPETGAVSDANLPQPGGRQLMKLFPAAGGGPIPGDSLSANYVFVDENPGNTLPPAVANRIALVKIVSPSTFAQDANQLAPLHPAAIILITATDTATALIVAGGIPTFTMGPDDANYLLSVLKWGTNSTDVPANGDISALPLRLVDSAPLSTFVPGMASFSSRGPNGHPNARFRVIKPDVTAPGVNILGAAVPDGNQQASEGLSDPSGYIQASGTSFSTPITSGTMALVRQRVRDLGLDVTNISAASYRSTRYDAASIARAFLMNSASNLRSGLGVPEGNGTNSSASLDDFGAGHINVDAALHANAIMVAPTLLLSNSAFMEFDRPTSDPPPASDYDSDGNLRVLIPSASFGAVPIVGVNGTAVFTQEVVLRDVTGGGGSGTYNLSFQDNRHTGDPGFQIDFVSASGSPTNSVTVLPGGRSSIYVRVTANGNLINVDPTEFQWFVTATHGTTGQKLRMPFYFRAVAPAFPNITSPVLTQIQADLPPQSPSTCVRDTNSSYTINWSYHPPNEGTTNAGPPPVGFRVQEATRTSNIFFDDASEPLVAGSNSKWDSSSPPAGSDWSSQINTNTGRLAYFTPDSANQNSSLFMVNSLQLPAGSATLSFQTLQNLEDGFDSVHVEISADGGATYTPVGDYMNDYVGKRTIDISQYATQAIKVRFRMQSDTLNGPPDATPLGWFIQDIAVASDDFHTVASPGPTATSLSVSGRANGTYYYRVAGLFNTDLGIATGPYSDTFCVSETILVPVIVSITTLTNGHELLDCRGLAGVKHRIQGAPDLRTWTDLGTNILAAPDGTLQFEDANTAGVAHRFYRLVTP